MADATAEANLEHIGLQGEAFDRLDIDTWVSYFHPDVEWTTLTDEPDAGVYRGREGIGGLARMWMENFEDLTVEETQRFAVGDAHVVQVSRLRGRGRGSGLELDAPYVFVYRFRGDMPDRVVEFRDRDEAVAAIEAGEV